MVFQWFILKYQNWITGGIPMVLLFQWLSNNHSNDQWYSNGVILIHHHFPHIKRTMTGALPHGI